MEKTKEKKIVPNVQRLEELKEKKNKYRKQLLQLSGPLEKATHSAQVRELHAYFQGISKKLSEINKKIYQELISNPESLERGKANKKWFLGSQKKDQHILNNVASLMNKKYNQIKQIQEKIIEREEDGSFKKLKEKAKASFLEKFEEKLLKKIKAFKAKTDFSDAEISFMTKAEGREPTVYVISDGNSHSVRQQHQYGPIFSSKKSIHFFLDERTDEKTLLKFESDLKQKSEGFPKDENLEEYQEKIRSFISNQNSSVQWEPYEKSAHHEIVVESNGHLIFHYSEGPVYMEMANDDLQEKMITARSELLDELLSKVKEVIDDKEEDELVVFWKLNYLHKEYSMISENEEFNTFFREEIGELSNIVGKVSDKRKQMAKEKLDKYAQEFIKLKKNKLALFSIKESVEHYEEENDETADLIKEKKSDVKDKNTEFYHYEQIFGKLAPKDVPESKDAGTAEGGARGPLFLINHEEKPVKSAYPF